MWICNKCGFVNAGDAIFCSKCGRKKPTLQNEKRGSKKLWLYGVAAAIVLCAVLAFALSKHEAETQIICFLPLAEQSSVVENQDAYKDNKIISIPTTTKNDSGIYVEGYQVLAAFPEDDIYIMGYGDGTAESGDHMLLCSGDLKYRFEFGWFTRHGIEFFEKNDIDSDGTKEYVLCVDSTVGSGTDVEKVIVFDPLPDGSFQGACLDDGDVQKIIQGICVAGRRGEDYILLRVKTDKGQTFKQVPSSKDNPAIGVEYKVEDGAVKARITLQFEYSVEEQSYLFVCDPWEIFDEDPETKSIFVDWNYYISADVLCDSNSIGLANIEVPGSYVDSATLT